MGQISTREHVIPGSALVRTPAVAGTVLLPLLIVMPLLGGCLGSGNSGSGGREVEQQRTQDARAYVVATEQLPFAAYPGFGDSDTLRLWGELDGAGYRIEIPRNNWNGQLVMYAHGYRGDAEELTVDNPEIRGYLLSEGFAWAASSYSANHYDVRAGVEDTNALAGRFRELVSAADETFPILETQPIRTYIVGQSMGGHVAGAVIESETLDRAENSYVYDGALALCGVMGDAELLNYFAAYNIAAMELAGVGPTEFPIPDASARIATVREALFANWDGDETALLPEPGAGEQLRALLMNLSGGERPVFDSAFEDAESARRQLDRIHEFADDDGTARGILARNIVDTRDIVYRFGNTDQQFNLNVYRVTPDPNPNPRQSGGLRWIPRLHGNLTAPVITLHTLGDLWVPFSMQQIYAARVAGQGKDHYLVQRAIRAVDHCDFTLDEQEQAFSDLVTWVDLMVKPDGDKVLDKAIVAAPDFGCRFTAGEDTPLFPCPAD